jgi:hypothetical protein
VRNGYDITTFTVQKVMKNPEALTFRIPKGLLRPAHGNNLALINIEELKKRIINDTTKSPQVLRHACVISFTVQNLEFI